MKFYKLTIIILAILFNIQSISFANDPSSLQIMWWNVKAFNSNGPLILQTLEDVADKYDVILLGESRKTEAEKFKKSPSGKQFLYSSHISYPGDSSLFISVLSRHPLTLIHTEKLTWGTPEQKKLWLKKYKQSPYNPDRNISFFEIEKGYQKYLIAPVHLLNPWPLTKSIDGITSTSFNIYFGESNPLFYQTQQAVEKISERNYLTSQSPFVLIGDFNSPSNPILGSTLKYISHYLGNLMQDNRPTFMAPALKIDHAYGSSNITVHHDEVLFYEGSDHYPIEIEISYK